MHFAGWKLCLEKSNESVLEKNDQLPMATFGCSCIPGIAIHHRKLAQNHTPGDIRSGCRHLSVSSPMGNKWIRIGIALGGVTSWSNADLGTSCTGCCTAGPVNDVELHRGAFMGTSPGP